MMMKRSIKQNRDHVVLEVIEGQQEQFMADAVEKYKTLGQMPADVRRAFIKMKRTHKATKKVKGKIRKSKERIK